MANIIEDTINFGFGLFAYSREKIEEMVEKLVDKGEVARQDARGLAKELTEKGDEQRKELKKMIQGEMRETLKEVGITEQSQPLTKDDIRAIIREELAAQKETGAK